MADTTCVKVCSVNVRGIRDTKKRKKIFQWIINQNIDIACLQETHYTEEYKQVMNNLWPGKVFHATSVSAYSKGVCILLKRNFPYKILAVEQQNDG